MILSKLMLVTLMATLAMAISGCGERTAASSEGPQSGPTPTAIYLQPLNDFTEAEAEAVALKLAQVTAETGRPIVAEILPPVRLGDEMKNDAGTRYRAPKILDRLKQGPKPVIALVHEDISCTYKGIDDWGVLGLSYLGRDVCVVSTHRVKNPRDFWKVVYHEFGHAHYGLPHCPADDPTCIMRDAKGHPQLGPQRAICDSCWHSHKR